MKTMRDSGFTLVELMVTVAIIAILASISLMGYEYTMQKMRRADAKTALTTLANQQERFFTECNYYASTMAGVRDCGADENAGVLGMPDTSNDGHYNLAVVPGAITGACSGGGGAFTCGYTATATPLGVQAPDGQFRMDSMGRQEWDKDNLGAWKSWNYEK